MALSITGTYVSSTLNRSVYSILHTQEFVLQKMQEDTWLSKSKTDVIHWYETDTRS